MSVVTLNDIVKGEYGSYYTIIWDGWKAGLELRRDGTGWLYPLHDYKNGFNVRAQYLADPQDNVDGQTGPGYLGTSSSLKHRIVFWVDFPRTYKNTTDDQRFDGYFFTQTKDGMAGVTWWNGIPFGFYAKYEGNVIG